jgi:hypothetical protein
MPGATCVRAAELWIFAIGARVCHHGGHAVDCCQPQLSSYVQMLSGGMLPWPLSYILPYSQANTVRKAFRGRDIDKVWTQTVSTSVEATVTWRMMLNAVTLACQFIACLPEACGAIHAFCDHGF